ncbi:MAG: hypothetical protein IJ048_01235, partial [Clostridia bacterium]|nr:hypothetical protein [Clostridia bacterium]
LEGAAASLREALEKEGGAPARAREGLEHFIRHHQFKSLTRAMLTELVERVEVREGGRISVLFRFREETARLPVTGEA